VGEASAPAFLWLRCNFLLPPPSARADTTSARIGLCEVALIGKAARARDLGERESALTQ
jgi:hypothetical protein